MKIKIKKRVFPVFAAAILLGAGPVYAETIEPEVTVDIVTPQHGSSMDLTYTDIVAEAYSDGNRELIDAVLIKTERIADGFYWTGYDWEGTEAWVSAEPEDYYDIGLIYWVLRPDMFEDGWYTAVAKARDGEYWSTVYSTVTFAYDTTPPQSHIVFPEQDGQYDVGISSIHGTAFDEVSGVDWVEVIIKNIDENLYWCGSSLEWVDETYITYNLAEGTTNWVYDTSSVMWSTATYTVWSRARDKAGLSEIEDTQYNRVTFNIGPVPPTFDFLVEVGAGEQEHGTSHLRRFNFIVEEPEDMYIDLDDGLGLRHLSGDTSGTSSIDVTGLVTLQYEDSAEPTTHTIRLRGSANMISFGGPPDADTSRESLLDILTPVYPGVTGITSARYMFRQVGVSSFSAEDFFDAASANVTDMSGMFLEAGEFNQDISSWTVSNVTDMSRMFEFAQSFDRDIGGWDVSNVENMGWMFNGANKFNQDIGGWDVSNVGNMGWMFHSAHNFNRDIGGWDVSNVGNMGWMFNGANKFNQDIGGWDVSRVFNMANMFRSAGSFDQDISGWDVSNVSNFMGFLAGTDGLSRENYNWLLIKWGRLELQNDVQFHAGWSRLSEGLPYERKHQIMSKFGWDITDGGTDGSFFPYTELTLRVADQDGDPVEGAQVAVMNVELSDEINPDHSLIFNTGPESKHLVYIGRNRSYRILASAQNYLPTFARQFESDESLRSTFYGAKNIDISLTESAQELGKIVAELIVPEDELPALITGQLMISGTPADEPEIGYAVLESTAGEITFYNVPLTAGAEYALTLFAPGMYLLIEPDEVYQASDFVGNILDAGVFDFTSEDASVPGRYEGEEDDVMVWGIIRSTSGERLSNVHIYATSETADGSLEEYDLRSRLDGTYRLRNPNLSSDILSSTFTFEVRKLGYVGVRDSVHIPAAQLLSGYRKDFHLEEAHGFIEGTVRLGGSPVPDGEVYVDGDWGRWYVGGSTEPSNYVENYPLSGGNTRINTDGSFRISGLAPGNYRLGAATWFSDGSYIYNYGPNRVPDKDYYSSESEYFEYHRYDGDDRRVTVYKSSFTVYSASAAVISTGTVDINIPPRIPGAPATVTGNLVLDEGYEITPESPVSILLKERRYDDRIISTETVTLNKVTGDAEEFYYVQVEHWIEYIGDIISIKDPSDMSDFKVEGIYIGYDENGNQRICWGADITGLEGVEELRVVYEGRYNPSTALGSVTGSGRIPYSIVVDDGKIYELEIVSRNFAVKWTPGLGEALDRIDFRDEGTTAKTLPDIELIPGGQISGQVLTPEGSVLRPVKREFGVPGTTYWYLLEPNVKIRARGVGSDSYGSAGLREDGTFFIGGLMPGLCDIRTESGFYIEVDYEKWDEVYGNEAEERIEEFKRNLKRRLGWAEARRQVNVRASEEPLEITLRLRDGVLVRPSSEILVNLSAAEEDILDYYYYWLDGSDGDRYDERGGIGILGMESGVQLTAERMRELLFNTELMDVGFGYDPFIEGGWWSDMRVAPGDYDLYLGAYIEPYFEVGQTDMSMIFHSRSRGVNIDPGRVIEGDDGLPLQEIHIPDAVFGNAGLSGSITGSGLISEEDLEVIRASFEQVQNLVPVVMLYDSSGRLAGVALNMPAVDEEWMIELAEYINEGDLETVNSMIAGEGSGYAFRFLRDGEYTAVFHSPNYPRVVRNVTLRAGDTVNIDINFDIDSGAAEAERGSIYALFQSTGGASVSGASVNVRGPDFNRDYVSSSAGEVRIPNLRRGVYYLTVSASGYERRVIRVEVREMDEHRREVVLRGAPEVMAGFVWSRPPSFGSRGLPYEDGAYIAAYNITDRGDLPALYETESDSEGQYLIDSLITGHIYRTWLIVPGYVRWSVDHEAGGLVAGYNFYLRNLNPDYHLSYRVESSSVVFSVRANKDMPSAPEISYRKPGGPEHYILNITTVAASRRWRFSIPFGPNLEEGENYALTVKGVDGDGREADNRFNFSTRVLDTSIVRLQEFVATGGEVTLDEESEDESSITVPPGAIEAATGGSGQALVSAFTSDGSEEKLRASSIGGLASLLFSRQGITGEIGGVISDIYTAEIDDPEGEVDIQGNLRLNLRYRRSAMGEKGGDPDQLNIRRRNPGGEWEIVEGVVSVDQTRGVASVEVSGFSSASASSGFSAQSGSQSGEYAVFYGIPEEQTGPAAYAGTSFRMYNFPNPFRTEEKQVTLADHGSLSAQQTVEGTVIKYYLPDKYGAVRVNFHIYNLAGELVRTLEHTPSGGGGHIYFTEWDGRNDRGRRCSSGVYFMLAEIEGKTVSREPLKMALIR